MSSTSTRRRRATKPALTDAAIAALAREHGEAAMQSLADWARKTAPEGYYFDEFEAARAAAFFPRYLRHTRGRWAGQQFELLGWQKETIQLTFGWKRADGTRRFRIVYVRVGRKPKPARVKDAHLAGGVSDHPDTEGCAPEGLKRARALQKKPRARRGQVFDA